jgi:putative addiction module killer protein
VENIEIEIYQEPSGKLPYLLWENGLSRDIRAIVTARMARIRLGNFGDCKSFDGIHELRIHYGPGYRIYYGKKGKTIVILLCGGDKSTQKKDIKKAKVFWEAYLQKQQKRKR